MRRLSPRELRRLTRRMGLELKELEGVEEVVIRFSDHELVIKDAKVSVIEMRGGGKIYQIIGTEERRELGEEMGVVEIPEEDIQLVALQTGVSLEEARAALKEVGGDLAKAIMLIKSKKGG